MYPQRAENLSEETTSFLDEKDIRVVVDSIVSVVSRTLGEEEEQYGASLYFDGQSFQHSVDCECMCCLFSGRNTNERSDSRRRLFANDYTQMEDRSCMYCSIPEEQSLYIDNCRLIETDDYPRLLLCIDCYEREPISCLSCGSILGDRDDSYCEVCDREIDTTYRIEYENIEPPENNTKKVKIVKESVKEIGEFVYDLQGKLSEGEYLKLMDMLQKITNDVNNL